MILFYDIILGFQYAVVTDFMVVPGVQYFEYRYIPYCVVPHKITLYKLYDTYSNAPADRAVTELPPTETNRRFSRAVK